MDDRPLRLLGGLTASEFLRDYWQKRPLFVRGAWPDLACPISAEELAGLACEEEVTARLVQERHRKQPWLVSYGPFDEKVFARLPKTHWTFLVNDCEKHVPELQALVEPFRFIPDWRIDDLQISYAADQGSVGPHYDDYDVFLLQLEGRREWRFGAAPLTDLSCVDGLDLRLLRHFDADTVVVVEPGDLLYLPPRVGHHGIAQGPCMTASVGFRAPAHRDLLHAFAEALVARTPEDHRYADPDLAPRASSAEITPTAVHKFRQTISALTAMTDREFRDWLGCYLTEPKLEVERPEQPLDAQRFTQWLGEADAALARNPRTRMAFCADEEAVVLYVNGECHALPAAFRQDVEVLSTAGTLRPWQLVHRDAPELQAVIYTLVCAGALEFGDGGGGLVGS